MTSNPEDIWRRSRLGRPPLGPRREGEAGSTLPSHWRPYAAESAPEIEIERPAGPTPVDTPAAPDGVEDPADAPAIEDSTPAITSATPAIDAPTPMSLADERADDHAAGLPVAQPALPWAVRPRDVPPNADIVDPSLYFNRELSWIDFNWRVLYQSLDERNPLLERVRFVAITENNLDEFVMKRVGGLKRQQAAGVVQPSPDGRTPGEQLSLIRQSVREMREWLGRIWGGELKGRLATDAGLVVREFEQLDDAEREHVHAVFRERIYPTLTPLAVDPGHPFPFLSNLSLSLALILFHPDRRTRHFARLKIPRAHRWLGLPTPGHVVPIEEVVRGFVEDLFLGMRVESASLFRVTRNADVTRDEEVAEDLLKMISEELRERRFAQVVRLEVEPSMPQEVREFLTRELRLDPEDLYEIEGLLDLSGLAGVIEHGPWEHRFEPWEPMIPPQLIREGETEDAPDIFAVIRAGDVMLHHPYDSFAATVQRFIEEAASDPAVIAIKQTLYRTSQNSEIIDALVRAAESGKEVAVLVEVTARFDEADNMEWASVLEEAGVHVTYGLVGLKTHAKIALVVRDEGEGVRAYCHVGTGNYNAETAHIYADIGILTARPEIGRDAVNLFHYLTGYAPEQQYEELIVAPRDLRRSLIERIEREADHARNGRVGRIIFKLNGLDDPTITRALYRASQAGVEIDLIVRGQCLLRPGIPGWSENIRVRSIVGRFLEHDRIYWWENDGAPEVWIGSADCRRRSLDGRVEVVMPIGDKRIRKRLRKALRFALLDVRHAWDLQPSGEYILASPEPGRRVVDYHRRLMRAVRKRRRKADAPWDMDPVG